MRNLILLLVLLALIPGGCSGSSNTPIMPQDSGFHNESAETIGSLPVINLESYGDSFNATGLLGAYELYLNKDTSTAELIAKRTNTIGEAYIVSGIGFFTITPCPDCLKLKGIGLDPDGNAVLTFLIDHPFEKGNIAEPPSAINRLDLHVFDLALVVSGDISTTTYSLTGADAILFGVNPAGLTTELAGVAGTSAALPYYLVIDDSIGGSSTYNKFEMGTKDVEFSASFSMGGAFDLYLTMGYGASAKKAGRLSPKYFNPEFNRKAAWKVVVTPPQGEDPPDMDNTWNDMDDTTPWPVTVAVYDWQQDKTIYGTPDDFENAPEDNIYASSNVSEVSVEIPGMSTSLPSVTTADSGSGAPDDPLIFTVPVTNDNLLVPGEYVGLVKVTDDRVPQAIPPGGDRDFGINSDDGVTLVNFPIDEFATFQTFIATVVIGNLMPVADAVATTPTTVLEGMAVTFDASASSDPDGTIDSYLWDFNEDGTFDGAGDEYTGNDWNPTHNFALGDGSIDVQLRVVDNLGGQDELDTPITITVNPSKNIVLRSGVDVSDVACIENTDEVLVMFEDHQVWKYDNALNSGSILYTMPGSGTYQRIDACSNGDSLCGWWGTSSRNSYSYFYNGSLAYNHNYTSHVPQNGEHVALYSSYNGYQADIMGFFTLGWVWINRYAPTSSPPYRNASGNLDTSPGTGPNNVDLNYVKGCHASRLANCIYWLEGSPEWRVERTSATFSYLSGYWGGTQTDADTGFWDPQDITSDSDDNVFVLDILSDGTRKIKKFTNSGGSSLGSFGDNTTISTDPERLDASFASDWIYVCHSDMISIFFPSEQ